MNTKTKTAIMALLLIGVLAVSGCVGGTTPATGGENETMMGEEEITDSGTGEEGTAGADEGTSGAAAVGLSQAISTGSSYKCEFTEKHEEGIATMTVWVKSGNMRASFTDNEGTQYEEIIKGDYMWVWSPVDKTGMKMELTTEEETSGDASDSSGGYDSETMEEGFTWECSPTSVADSKFQVPSDVEITDLSEFSDTTVTGVEE